MANWLGYVPIENESDLKALYSQGGDNRHNIHESVVLPDVKRQAESVACLIEQQHLLEKGNGFELLDVPKLKDRFKPLSLTAKFIDEPSPGFGTAFLVKEDLALTAGHVFQLKGQNLSFLLKFCKSLNRVEKFTLLDVRNI